MVETPTISLHKGKDAQKRAYQTTIIVVETENALDAMGKVIIQIIRMEKRKIIFAQPAMELNNVQLAMVRDSDKKVISTKNIFGNKTIYLVSTYGNQDAIRYGCLGGGGIFTGILIAIAQKWK